MHARRLFEVGTVCGHDMRLLDLGGGFIGVSDDPDALLFEHVSAVECKLRYDGILAMIIERSHFCGSATDV